MRFSLPSVAALAFAVASVSAQLDNNFNDVFKPTKFEVIPAGKTYKVEWKLPESAKKGPVSIILIGGQEQLKQQPITTLEKGYDNSKLFYDWAVDASLGALPFYGLMFTLDADSNTQQYSNPFTISGGSAGNDTKPSSSSSKPPTTMSTSTSTSTSTTIETSGTTTVAPPTVTPPTSGGPAPTTTGPTSTGPTPPANTTRPGTVPPNAAAGFSVSGPLALVGGLVAFMLAL